MLVAQSVQDGTDAAVRIGEVFGFAGLVAVVLLLAGIVLGWFVFNTWRENEAIKTEATIESTRGLVAAQQEAYKEQIANTRKIGNAIEVLASTTGEKYLTIKNISEKTDQLHLVAKQAILIAIDMLGDDPVRQTELRKILNDLK